jgi:GNAT superfamily N-acetyltransferase
MAKPDNDSALQLLELTESVERQALLSWFEAASRSELPGIDWNIEQIGDALCSVSATEPSILINRVLGFGSNSTPTLEQLDEIKRVYREAGVSRFFLHILPRLLDPETEKLLTEAGLRRHRAWMKFTRGNGEADPVNTDLTIRQIGPDEAADFAAIVAPAFDIGPAFQPALAALADDPGWHLYMSFDGDRPAGTGGLYISGNTAYTDWGATHPDFRRRGSQTAILNARIRHALDAGCTMIATMTGEAVPGDPQHSYSNILKRGFSEACLRQNWIPADS